MENPERFCRHAFAERRLSRTQGRKRQKTEGLCKKRFCRDLLRSVFPRDFSMMEKKHGLPLLSKGGASEKSEGNHLAANPEGRHGSATVYRSFPSSSS
jgi:hypothetical protein